VSATLGYDHAGNQTSASVAGAASLENLTYSYAVGTADKQLQQTAGNVTSGVTTTYAYDNHDRLSGASTGTGSTSQSYTYDLDGNLATENLGGTTKTFQYNASDALCWAMSGTSANACSSAPTGATTYSYDANGNQTASSAGESISYNSVNQTTSLTPAGGSALSMAYTGTDSTQRTTAGSTTYSTSIFGVAGSTTGSTTTYFTRDASGRLNSILVGSTRYYVYYDGAGSVAGMFNSSGTSVATYAYDPYGATTTSGTQAAADPFRFKGGYQDTTGYYKFGTRFYLPNTAAWTQQDSIAGTVQNPSAVNRYPYAADDPVNLVDPSGMSILDDIAAGVGAALAAVGVAALFVTLPVWATALAAVVGVALAVYAIYRLFEAAPF
jgi:RHS repeat-associated protein